jgi:hypothetical protein
MKIPEPEFQNYMEAIPPVIWAWIYTELKEGEAKRFLHTTPLNETDHSRDLNQPWIRNEENYMVSKYPEIRAAAEICATNYYIRHSWRKWLPWNWGK